MAYGVKIINQSNTVILGENTVPMMVEQGVAETVSEYDRIYSPPNRIGGIPMFRMNSSIDRFDCRGGTGGPYNYFTGTSWEFNNRADIGPINARYLMLGDRVSYPNGGHGIIVRDSSGKVTYNSNGVLFQPEEVIVGLMGGQVTIPNNKWIACLLWYFGTASSFYQTAQLRRVGTSTTWDVTVQDGTIISPPSNGTLMAVILTVTI